MNKLPTGSGDSTDHQTFRLEHQILVLDAFLKHPLDDRRYKSITRRFIDDLLAVLGMQALGDLGIYPAIDRRAPGWSFIQPITTSHISAHYFRKPGRQPNIRIDAYSCETINWKAIVRVCHSHFELDDWHATFIDRSIDEHDARKVLDLCGSGPSAISESIMWSTSRLQNVSVS